jgi:phosphoribosylamine--glycine ligase
MRALLLGSGGRESALAWALARSSVVDDVVAAPGNPGMAEVVETVAVPQWDAAAVRRLAHRFDAGLVVVGPEAPLVAGVGDALREDGRLVFGPDARAAAVEGSKSYAKSLMGSTGIPTASARTFDEVGSAIAYLDSLGPPYVIKADGLAAGKGVVVTTDRREAIAALEERLVAGAFGAAGARVVIEEYLDGEEVSLIAFCDGRTALVCEPAQDFKRALDGDRGPNTGGMGSYSPVPACPPEVVDRIRGEIIEPMVRATAAAGAPFVGALYAGLALTEAGPKVVEFNARFGDPETQALLPRLRSDLGELCLAAATGDLRGCRLEWSAESCVTVVLCSGGYPGEHGTGATITGLDAAGAQPGAAVFHAGTARTDRGIVTAGGRVLAVSALGPTIGRARARAYDAAAVIEFEGKHVRSDIALVAAERSEGWIRSSAS